MGWGPRKGGTTRTWSHEGNLGFSPLPLHYILLILVMPKATLSYSTGGGKYVFCDALGSFFSEIFGLEWEGK